MSFLYPAYWAWMVLAITPLLLLYLLRRKQSLVPVSTLLFWEKLRPAERNRPWWRKLRRWVSWLLQVLMLLFLVLALTRPQGGTDAREVPSTLILLDASISMKAAHDGTSAWEESLDQIRGLMRSVRAGEEVALILAGETPRVLIGWSDNPRELQRSLERAETIAGSARLEPAIDLGKTLLRERENSRLLVFTNHVWAKDISPDVLPENLQWASFRDEIPHAGLTHFSARRSPQIPGEYLLQARVDNSAATAFRGEVRLLRNDQLLSARTLELEPGATWEYAWRGRSPGETRFRIFLRQAEGIKAALNEDQDATLTLPAAQQLPVTLVGPADPFWLGALRAIPQVSFRYFESFPEDSTDLDGFWIFLRETPPDFWPKSVPTLIVMPGEDPRFGELEAELESDLVSNWEREHPIFRFVEWEGTFLRQVQQRIVPESDEIFAQGLAAPLIFGRWDRDQRWMTMAFSPSSSEWVLQTAFPIFVSNLMQSLNPTEVVLQSPLPGVVETRLQSLGPGLDATTATRLVRAGWFSFPWWQWALLAALAWIFLEWWSWNRRWSE